MIVSLPHVLTDKFPGSPANCWPTEFLWRAIDVYDSILAQPPQCKLIHLNHKQVNLKS